VVNTFPDLCDKADIVRNAVDLARLLGVERPKVAVLGAVEDVEPSMPSTIHAATLAQMGRRGQLGPATVDGPLALDDALDARALAAKGIASPLGGQADVLVVPTIEAGNILYKALVVLGGAVAAGVVVQTPVPVVLASRSDSVETRVASAALGSIWVGRAAVPLRAAG
jgi:phosphotransacetylase